ncbi:MAG TPA: hypothetical protein VFH54_14615 [Mycobacteriales bacterium]|nr:hypothetical protein [Mycobacteriales bacterium]
MTLPDDAVLLHVGPHKTGTTALQNALHASRAELRRNGVTYPGRDPQHRRAARAVTGGKALLGERPIRMREWDQVVRETGRRGRSRVVISSECFDLATDEVAQRIASDLGRSRLHVLVTVRPLAKILPSTWQEQIRYRDATPYDEWLRETLDRAPDRPPTSIFWRRQHHDLLVDRWVRTVGADRVTVLVADEAEPDLLLRNVEQMLALPSGLLAAETGQVNRSLSAVEAELVRALNVRSSGQGWPDAVYRRYVLTGLLNYLQRERIPGPDEPRLTLPDWAGEQAAALGQAAAAEIAASGARVIGDLQSLGRPGTLSAVDGPPPVPAAAAADLLVGLIELAHRPPWSLHRRARRALRRTLAATI